jgi:hypothetical protein
VSSSNSHLVCINSSSSSVAARDKRRSGCSSSWQEAGDTGDVNADGASGDDTLEVPGSNLARAASDDVGSDGADYTR